MNKYTIHILECLRRPQSKRDNPLKYEVISEISDKWGIDFHRLM